MLFKPYQLSTFTLRNRLVMAPMTTYSSNPDFTVSDEEMVYFKRRAKHLGMVITAATAVSAQAQAFSLQMSLKDDAYIPSQRALAKAIQSEGALAVIQLHHGGRMNVPSLHADPANIVSASAIKAERDGVVTPRALETEEVENVIEDFVAALKRAIEAGFDGAELHGANTYLLQQFFSPHSNRRTDRFGGSLDKRMTFAKTLIERCHQAIKEAGRPFLLGYRFSPEELENPGITLEDTEALVAMLKTQPLDFLHVSLGRYHQSSIRDQQDTRKIVDVIQATLNHAIPLIGVGGIHSKETAEEALSLGYDLVATGMSIIADPDWALKIQTGEPLNKIIGSKLLLPTPLYQRLLNNKPWFERNGYTFEEI